MTPDMLTSTMNAQGHFTESEKQRYGALIEETRQEHPTHSEESIREGAFGALMAEIGVAEQGGEPYQTLDECLAELGKPASA